MKKYIKKGLKRGTLTWLCFCLTPMSMVILITYSAAKTSEWSWIFWSIAAVVMWAFVVLAESVDYKRRHGDQ